MSKYKKKVVTVTAQQLAVSNSLIIIKIENSAKNAIDPPHPMIQNVPPAGVTRAR